jgi:hypothetical protein
MFDTAAGLLTIDGWTVGDIAERLGVDVVIGESPRDLLLKTLEAPAPRVPDWGRVEMRAPSLPPRS